VEEEELGARQRPDCIPGHPSVPNKREELVYNVRPLRLHLPACFRGVVVDRPRGHKLFKELPDVPEQHRGKPGM
jgi:hypothetical protein